MRDQPRHGADFLTHQIAERAAIASHGNKQHHEILHGPANTTPASSHSSPADNHLGRQHRSDQRSGPAMAAKW